jgi:hypothetical protein
VKEFSIKKISSKSNTIDTKFLGMAVPALWERNQRRVKTGRGQGKVHQLNGVMHIDANLVLADIEPLLPEAILGKLKLNFTGSDPLSHPQENELVESMLKNAKELHNVSRLSAYLIMILYFCKALLQN